MKHDMSSIKLKGPAKNIRSCKMLISEKDFNLDVAVDISNFWYGENWPVVYILNDDKDAYIGETTSINNRMKQHLKTDDRARLKKINIIAHDEFNKSAVLDIESKLIEYMSADKKYRILNNNSGMRNHNYYDKKNYEKLFVDIWKDLLGKNIVLQELEDILNTELFKYTPYKRLTEEQYSVIHDILLDIVLMIAENKVSTKIVNGEAGTGKTVLAMYLMKLFADNKVVEFISKENEELFDKFIDVHEKLNNYKIGLVVPMTTLRKTLKKVMRNIEGLKPSMVIGPNDVAKEKFDLLIVDEAHRLHRRKSITNYGSFDDANKNLNLKKDATQLEWIINQSKHQIFFYDSLQSVRPSDIREEDFMALQNLMNFERYKIKSQFRVKGGEDYLKYIKDIFGNNPPKEKTEFTEYEFRLYDSITEMQSEIIKKNNKFGLSRIVAGYAWPWNTKGLKYKEAKDRDIYDIEIEGEKMIWNTNLSGWAIDKHSINEVGSIHTIQGYDLNYAGVIIGNDIYYNPESKKIEICKNNYFDTKGKQGVENDEELEQYIINIYTVLLSRAIRGTYVYVCDENLREYLKQFI